LKKPSVRQLQRIRNRRLLLTFGGAGLLVMLTFIVGIAVASSGKRASRAARLDVPPVDLPAPRPIASAVSLAEPPTVATPLPIEPPTVAAALPIEPRSSRPALPIEQPDPRSTDSSAHIEQYPPAIAAAEKPAIKPGPPQGLATELMMGYSSKRLHDWTETEIVNLVAKMPTLTLDKSTARLESIEVIRARAQDLSNFDLTPALLNRRADLAGLPLRRGSAARLKPDAIEHLTKGASELQGSGSNALASDPAFLQPDRMPAMLQVLMVASERDRTAFAKHLAKVQGPRAAAGLVQIALFDPSAFVRGEAVAALALHPADEYRALLLRGFRSPWPLAAEHAAEALVVLKRTESIPTLLALVKAPDPRDPYSKDNGPVRYVRDMVRIKHKLNCLMCHPASFDDKDPLRREVPSLRDLVGSPGFGYGFGGIIHQPHAFVRADVTFLFQDYSIMLQGERYDLVARERLSGPLDEVALMDRQKAGRTPYQAAAAFAIRELIAVESETFMANWLWFVR
jgi:hypothetical protein